MGRLTSQDESLVWNIVMLFWQFVLCQDATTMFREDGDGSSAAQNPASAPSCLRSFNHFSSLLILLSHFTDLYRYFIFLQINQRSFHHCGISRDSQCDLTQLTLESCVNIDNRNIYSLVSLVCLVFIRFWHTFWSLWHCRSLLPPSRTEVKNMVTDVRISLQPLAEESKTGPFGICEGPVACFDLEPKAWLAAQCYTALFPISLLVATWVMRESVAASILFYFVFCILLSRSANLLQEVLALCSAPTESRTEVRQVRTNPFSPTAGAAAQWLQLVLSPHRAAIAATHAKWTSEPVHDLPKVPLQRGSGSREIAGLNQRWLNQNCLCKVCILCLKHVTQHGLKPHLASVKNGGEEDAGLPGCCRLLAQFGTRF